MSRLMGRVEKLEAQAGAAKGQKVLLISIHSWPANLPRDRADALGDTFLDSIEGHEAADMIIFMRTSFAFQDGTRPALEGHEWQTWGSR